MVRHDKTGHNKFIKWYLIPCDWGKCRSIHIVDDSTSSQAASPEQGGRRSHYECHRASVAGACASSLLVFLWACGCNGFIFCRFRSVRLSLLFGSSPWRDPFSFPFLPSASSLVPRCFLGIIRWLCLVVPLAVWLCIALSVSLVLCYDGCDIGS